MLPYREIIEIYSIGFSYEKVAYLCGCNVYQIQKIVRRAKSLGIGWPVPIELSDEELRQLVDPETTISDRLQPDFASLIKGITNKPERRHFEKVWANYLQMAEEAQVKHYSQKQLQRMYADWCRTHVSKIAMNINWTPGEVIQVDWAGKTLYIHGKTGETLPVYLFVATLPYSDYTFVRASLDMGMQSWLEHHRHMFTFFGGTPLFLYPDNLKTGVQFKGGKKFINEQYQALAEYYDTIVFPTRSNKPKDKAAVERSVQFIANKIIRVLQQMRFSSIDQVNFAIQELLAVCNRERMIHQGRSREDIFLLEEKECLGPLPEKPFTSVTSRKYKASSDGVVCVRGVYYQVPESYIEQDVWVRISDDYIDIFTLDRKQKIAHHPRGIDGSETFEGFPGREPDRFKPLDEWAEQNQREAMLAQWHPTKNGDLTPHDVARATLKRIWWKCPDCDYEWQEAPANRTKRNWDDCLACANVALIPGRNDLATTHPEIAAEWHPTKNGYLPSEVFPDYKLSVWWQGACGHEWLASIKKRTQSAVGRLCPYCSGREVLKGFNDVATLCPELVSFWHPTKNRDLTPEGISVCSSKKIFLWNGLLKEIWLETPKSWMLKNGFKDKLEPFLTLIDEAKKADKVNRKQRKQLASDKNKTQVKLGRFIWEKKRNVTLQEWCELFNRQDLLQKWHTEKNAPLTPKDVIRSDKQLIWWRCENGHEWQRSISDSTIGNGSCPYCSQRRLEPGYNDLASRRPSLIKFWHPTKNGNMTPAEILDVSIKKVWWLGKCGHEWQRAPRFIYGVQLLCPICHRPKKVLVQGQNDLVTMRPRIAKQWHPAKNGDLKPENVTFKSTRIVWWLGECGHEWQQEIGVRTRSHTGSCPYCLGLKVLPGFNDLATRNPKLAAEWHPIKNQELTPKDITSVTHKKVWWLGKCGHEWQAVVGNRSRGAGCPYCKNKKLLKGFNDLATTHPEIAAEWHFDRNKGLMPQDVLAGSTKKVWWKCAKGHEWKAQVSARSRGSGCPYCAGRKLLVGFNDLATKNPDIAAEWHPALNGDLLPQHVIAGSGKKAWWLGGCGHEWEAAIRERSRGTGCPYCSGNKLLVGFNDLATKNPQLAAEWKYELNKGLTPKDVMVGSGKKVWWQCSEGHVWKTSVMLRNNGTGCPICNSNRKPERPIQL